MISIIRKAIYNNKKGRELKYYFIKSLIINLQYEFSGV